jgi:hypothetical protein
MNNDLLKLIAIAALASAPGALADSPDWKYVEGSYLTSEFDDNDADDVEPDGFGIKGSWLFEENWFVQGSYEDQEDDINVPGFGSFDVEFSNFNIGGGYRYGLQENTDIYGRVSFESWDIEVGPFDEDDQGYSAAAGIRSVIWEGLEVNAEGGYIDVGDFFDGEGFWNVGAIYNLPMGLGFGVSYGKIDDLETLKGTVRYSFR